MKSIRPTPRSVEFRCDDPNVTPAAGLATVAAVRRPAAARALVSSGSGCDHYWLRSHSSGATRVLQEASSSSYSVSSIVAALP